MKRVKKSAPSSSKNGRRSAPERESPAFSARNLNAARFNGQLVEFPPENETQEEKYKRRQAWPVFIFRNFEEADRHESELAAAMTPEERFRLALWMVPQLSRLGWKQAPMRTRKTRIRQNNWPK